MIYVYSGSPSNVNLDEIKFYYRENVENGGDEK